MSTKEQAIHDDHESSPTSQSKGQASNPPTFTFNVALSTAVAVNGEREATAPVPNGPLTPEMLDKMNRYWRADEHPLRRS